MRYKFCEQLKNCIFFDSSCVVHCCNCGHDRDTIIIDDYKGEKIDWKKLIKDKLKIQENAKKGIIPYNSCKNCYMWREDVWNEGGYISEIIISSWTTCNCNCFYCYTAADKDFYNNFKTYDIYRVLKDFQKSKLINFKKDNGGIVRLLGGDVGTLKDFDKIVNLFLEEGAEHFYIPTSAVKYLPIVEKVLKEGKAEVIVSPDSSNRELYKKIKRIDAYEQVKQNMKKYANAAANTKSTFISKFIIIPYINDSKEEIDNWLKECKEIGVTNVAYDIEDNFTIKFSQKIPKKIPELFDYLERRGKEENMKVTRFRFAYQLLFDLENGTAKYSENESDFIEQKKFMEKFRKEYCL
ncbi:MAG: radical SAM protein [Candidatus Gastranaerophilales bacterium]|nr:radical SAM protein [Candidatus Gastranaerophilales bacterium]